MLLTVISPAASVREGRLGAWLDPIADKLLLTSLYISFGVARTGAGVGGLAGGGARPHDSALAAARTVRRGDSGFPANSLGKTEHR